MDFIDLRKEAARLGGLGESVKAGNIEGILEVWPEAIGLYNRHGVLRICSADVNKNTDQVEFEQVHDGNTSFLEVWAFEIVSPHDRIYSDPPCFCVAKSEPMSFGYVPVQDWDKYMHDCCIRKSIIDTVKTHLTKRGFASYK